MIEREREKERKKDIDSNTWKALTLKGYIGIWGGIKPIKSQTKEQVSFV